MEHAESTAIAIPLGRIIYSVCTLYMVALMLRWASPYLELETGRGYLGWLPKITDPAFRSVRKLLPHLGPMDLAPIATVLLVWLVRTILLKMFHG